MRFKSLVSAVAIASLGAGLSVSAAAEDEFTISGNVTLATDYVFRGQSQTDEEAAIQGGFDMEFGGFYLGTWASNVDFGTDAQAEIDYYGGYNFGITEDLSLDVGYIYYSYAGESDLNYNELKAAIGWRDLTVGVNYSWDYLGKDPFGEGDVDFYYWFADYSFALPADFSLGLHVALNSADGSNNNIAFEEDPENEYTEWNVSLGKSLFGVDFALTYWGTTIDEDDNKLGDDRVVFSVSKSL